MTNILDDYTPSNDLIRLAVTDVEAAELKRSVEAAAYILKKKKYIEFLAATGNNEERKAHAETSGSHTEAIEKYLDAVVASESIQNERKTCQLRIEVWRSVNANRRQAP